MSAVTTIRSGSCTNEAEPPPRDVRMLRKVVVAVDNGEPAKWAIDAAIPLTRRFGGKLSLLHATAFPIGWPAGIEPNPEDLSVADPDTDIILQESSRLVPVELRGEKILREGDADQKIVDVIRSLKADLLVLGTHDRNAAMRWLLGSTAEAAVRYAPCPVLVVGHPVSADFRETGPHRILIAIDDSKQAGWAATLGVRIAEQFSATVILVHVVPDVTEFPPTYGVAPQGTVQETVRNAGEAFLARFILPTGERAPVERVLCEGSAATEIVTAARENDADLILIGTHGRHGLKRLILGSTAESVLRHAHCPVLCIAHEV